MYRCTECNKKFDVCPSFCDCGNDTFEEIYEDTSEYYEPEAPKPVKQRKLSPEELEEYLKEKQDKKKALIAISVCVLLAIIVLFLPPYREKKMEKVKHKAQIANVKLPQIDTYWDNSLPSAFRKVEGSVLPVLNERFGSISPQLREYLVNVGSEFNRKWNSALVKGAGECKVEFTINKEGGLDTKHIVTSTKNESLDDSVLLALSNVNSFDIPPADYKGERIFLSFKVTEDQGSKVYFPNK